MVELPKRDVVDQDPKTVWEGLTSNPDSALIDVRTQSEWAFVGVPDLIELGRKQIMVEWLTLPSMQINQDFFHQVEDRFQGEIPSTLYFICRSGSRSRSAAGFIENELVQRGKNVNCINVSEGFEGDLNHEGHRGTVNGWKVKGLPWKQS